jgi:hypothetical protein
MEYKEKGAYEGEKAIFNAEKRNDERNVEYITQNDDEKDDWYDNSFSGGNRERGIRTNEIIGFSRWCNGYSSYIEPMFNIHIEHFIKGLKDIAIDEPDIKDFYEFAYENSSGIINAYL